MDGLVKYLNKKNAIVFLLAFIPYFVSDQLLSDNSIMESILSSFIVTTIFIVIIIKFFQKKRD